MVVLRLLRVLLLLLQLYLQPVLLQVAQFILVLKALPTLQLQGLRFKAL